MKSVDLFHTSFEKPLKNDFYLLIIAGRIEQATDMKISSVHARTEASLRSELSFPVWRQQREHTP